MIKMKRTYLLVLILFLSVSLSAQKDKQAREILDKTANALQQAGGIRATFGGTGSYTVGSDKQNNEAHALATGR